jgi:hypothetical protein
MTERTDVSVSTPEPAPSAAGNVLSWPQWQREVLRLLQAELRDLAHHLCLDDVDWAAWRPLYEQGRTPPTAVDRALERDL